MCPSNRRRSTAVPVPVIVSFDATANNPIKRPYMVQLMVPGDLLLDVYPSFTLDERRQMVLEVVKLLKQMSLITFSSIGILRATEGGNAIEPRSFNDPYFWNREDRRNYEFVTSEPPSSMHKFFMSRYWYLMSFKQRFFPDNMAKAGILFNDMVLTGILLLRRLYGDERTVEERTVLHHTDLAARNIMVNKDDNGRYYISAVLDWDNAAAVPEVMAYEFPTFLWEEEDKPRDVEYDGDTHDCDANGTKVEAHDGGTPYGNSTPPKGDNLVASGHNEVRQLFEREISREIPKFLPLAKGHQDLRRLAWIFASPLRESDDRFAAADISKNVLSSHLVTYDSGKKFLK